MTRSAAIRRSLIRLLAIGIVTGLVACAYGPYYHAPPPPHAKTPPAYYYDYYYYPHVDVYFDVHLGYYYYRKDKAWLRVRYLPRNLYLDPRYRVELRLDYEKPYLRHEQHRNTYQHRFAYRPLKEKERITRNREERNHNFRRHEEYLKKDDKHRR